MVNPWALVGTNVLFDTTGISGIFKVIEIKKEVLPVLGGYLTHYIVVLKPIHGGDFITRRITNLNNLRPVKYDLNEGY